MSETNGEPKLGVYKAISLVQAALAREGISKDRTNAQQGFKFRGIDDVMNALGPLLPQHGLLIFPRVLKREMAERQTAKGGAIFSVVLDVEFDFVSNADGSKRTVGPVIGEAMDTGDKASGKALSYAYKSACLLVFCVPTEGDNDPDAHAHEVAPKAVQATPPPATPQPSMADRAHAAMLKLGAALDAKDREVVKGLLAFAAVPGKGLDHAWLRWLQTHCVHAVIERLPTNGEMPDLARELNQLGLITPSDYALIQAAMDAEAVPA